MKDFYKILQVATEAEAEIITSAYKTLARKYHPDTYKGPGAEDRMKEINGAYEVLNNHLKRTDYDRSRKGTGDSPPPSDKKDESDLNECPFCAELIKAKAIKCKHCGEMVNVNAKDGAEMILIPAGEFLMGSQKGQGNDNERPQHRVYLDAYYISNYEVTNEQFAQFMRGTGYDAGGDWKKYAKAGKEKHPVVCVNWDDAMAYCRWAGGTLPTEAQWEKAARGNDDRQYPWGDSWEAGRCKNNSSGTTAVGSYPGGASPYGLQDMAGNIWEWCSDWFGDKYYGSSPSRNPEGPRSGVSRVVRGGSRGIACHNSFRCANRYGDLPDFRNSYCGFRFARTPR